jgi:CO/xanthine dehydrogenase Mo-binding subunit
MPTRTAVDLIGASMKKLDAGVKTEGRFEYASDLNRPGMLFACTVRSRHAHARLLGVDTSAALRLGGVRAVLTADDVPGRRTFGLEVRDQPVLAFDRIRYWGEPVAIVAADDPETAKLAARLVTVEVEPLDPVVDVEAALESDPLHDRPPHEPHWFADPRPNVIRTVRIVHNDEAVPGEVSVSGVYELGRQDPAFLGPEAGVAVPDGHGGVDIHVATQWLHQDLPQVADCLGLSENDVRIHLAGVGGAFGGREDLSGQIHAAMLALRTGRPVKFMYARDESFVGHVHRHPARIWAEHRADRDGRLVCVRVRTLLDGGAYASGSPSVVFNAASMAIGPYRVPNALLEATAIYTNNPPTGAMRGFGVVQACFAAEAQMDRLAKELGMDPVELRLRNAMVQGDLLPTGDAILDDMPTAETIRRCADLTPPEPEALPRDPIRLPGGAGNTTRGEGVRRGVGFAMSFKNTCYSGGYDDYSAAALRLYADTDGELVAELHSAAVEFGQGMTNALVQIARSELDLERVTLVPASTLMPSSGSSSASRQTWMSGGAVRLCCIEAREQLEQRGGLEPGEEIRVERVHRHPPTDTVDAATGQVPTGGRAHVAMSCAAMKVAVEVDVDLGLVRVVWVGTTQDVGKAINPLAVEGQIEGGVAQGMGLAVMEEVLTTDGVIANGSFTDYLIPTALDMPRVEIDLIEHPHPESPYGLKGVGESPAIVSTAAVAAAIRDATGAEISRVPVRPEHIALGRRSA